MKRKVMIITGLCLLCSGFTEAVYKVGDTVSDFTRTDAYGASVSLYDYVNWVIVLAFWTSS